MAHPYQDDSWGHSGHARRGPPRDDRDGRMYDDRSRSRSPGGLSRSPHGHPDRRHEYPRNRDDRPRYRSRDRDEYGRRGSPSPHSRRGRASYRDRDDEGYRSPRYSRSRSHSRGAGARHGQSQFGQESREVMIEGFPVDMSQDDIYQELRNAYRVNDLEDVRVIRDRQTKVSRQLGFLRFQSIDESRDFLERNHPFIYLYGPTAKQSSKVRIAYSREREDRSRNPKGEWDWTCRMCGVLNFSTRQKCFRCNAPRPEMLPSGPPGAPAQKVANNGDNDAAPENEPSQFLLVRGLDGSVSEELLAKGVAKLYRPAPESQDSGPSNKKGAKVASTTGDANLGAKEGSLRRVLLVRDRKTDESWRYGFAEFGSITDAQAAMTRLHSFEKFTISSRPVMVSYIHAGVFVPVMDPKPNRDRFTFSPLSNPSMKLMYWDDYGYCTELGVSAGDDENSQDTSRADKQTTIQEGQGKTSKDMEKAKKRKAETASNANAKKLAMPSHLQFWSNRHAELHGIPKEGEAQSMEVEQEQTAPPSQSYADLNRNCCYLCMRQFKSTANVNRHERLSELHQTNLKDPELRDRGMSKLVKHGIVTQPSAEYRDRARERRQAFGRGKGGPRPKQAPPPKEQEEAPVNVPSKGASLLSKMGWSEGSGLGAQGTGVTAPIPTEVYAQGVGLGAQGGKLGDAVEEASRNTRNRYDDFLEKTKETARQRFDQMSQ